MLARSPRCVATRRVADGVQRRDEVSIDHAEGGRHDAVLELDDVRVRSGDAGRVDAQVATLRDRREKLEHRLLEALRIGALEHEADVRHESGVATHDDGRLRAEKVQEVVAEVHAGGAVDLHENGLHRALRRLRKRLEHLLAVEHAAADVQRVLRREAHRPVLGRGLLAEEPREAVSLTRNQDGRRAGHAVALDARHRRHAFEARESDHAGEIPDRAEVLRVGHRQPVQHPAHVEVDESCDRSVAIRRRARRLVALHPARATRAVSPRRRGRGYRSAGFASR